MNSLNRSTALARELVHRTALAEVLLTDVQQEQEHVFTAAAQWSRSHPTFNRGGDGRHNPLLVAETMRELGICIPLKFYGVEEQWHFLIEELKFEIEPGAEPKAGYGGTEITCEVGVEVLAVGREGRGAVLGVAPAPGVVQRMRLSVRFVAEGGGEFARAEGVARFLTPTAYAVVRGRGRGREQGPGHVGRGDVGTCEHGCDCVQAARVLVVPDPAGVGVTSRSDLLIGLDPDDGRTVVLPTDPYHPFFFDHVSDHIPGMVLVEAVRQAAALQAGRPEWRVVGCQLRPLCFTEQDPPAEIVCLIDGPVTEFEVRQFGKASAVGRLWFEGG